MYESNFLFYFDMGLVAKVVQFHGLIDHLSSIIRMYEHVYKLT